MNIYNVIKPLFLNTVLIITTFTINAQEYLDYSTFLKKNVSIAGLQFSTDGKSLLYAITKVDWENNRRKTDYVVYDIVAIL